MNGFIPGHDMFSFIFLLHFFSSWNNCEFTYICKHLYREMLRTAYPTAELSYKITTTILTLVQYTNLTQISLVLLVLMGVCV